MSRPELAESAETTNVYKVWTPHFHEKVTGVVLCIRSAVTQAKYERDGVTLKKGVSQPTDYAPIEAYTGPLQTNFGSDLWVDVVPSAPTTLFAVSERAATQRNGLTLCMVEATVRVPPLCCLSVHNTLHKVLTEAKIDTRSVVPVLIVDPQRSHRDFLGTIENDGPTKLIHNAQERGIHVIKTCISETETHVTRFLSQLRSTIA